MANNRRAIGCSFGQCSFFLSFFSLSSRQSIECKTSGSWPSESSTKVLPRATLTLKLEQIKLLVIRKERLPLLWLFSGPFYVKSWWQSPPSFLQVTRERKGATIHFERPEQVLSWQCCSRLSPSLFSVASSFSSQFGGSEIQFLCARRLHMSPKQRVESYFAHSSPHLPVFNSNLSSRTELVTQQHESSSVLWLELGRTLSLDSSQI